MTDALIGHVDGHGPLGKRDTAHRGDGSRCDPVLDGHRGPDRHRRLEPEPARLRPSVRYDKEEVFEICGALALAEVVLAKMDRPLEAAWMAAVFDLVEGRLAR